MALMITEACINCGHCIEECPNQAIYEPGMEWTMGEGTSLSGKITLNERDVLATEFLPPLSEEYHFIVPEKCSECRGVHKEPQCRVVCPDPSSFKLDNTDEKIINLLIKQFQLNL